MRRGALAGVVVVVVVALVAIGGAVLWSRRPVELRPPEIPVLGRKPAPLALLRALPMVAYTAIWNVTGHPAASVPAGLADDGLPLAVQLVARRNDEATLFALSAQIESVRPWADSWPQLEG